MSHKDIEIQEVQFPYCRGIMHVVQRGDTLYKLSKQYRVKLSDIMLANPYVNVYNLQVGDELCIPAARAVLINQDEIERLQNISQGNMNQGNTNQENMTSGNNTMPGNNTVPGNNMTPGNTTVPRNNMTPGNTTVPRNNMTPGNTTVPRSNMTPGNNTVPRNNMTPGNNMNQNNTGNMTRPITGMPTGEGIEEITFSGSETISDILEQLGINMEQFLNCIRNLSEN